MLEPEPAPDDLLGRAIGEYVLCERIGEGGFGAVYRCQQPLLDREAVIKVLHPRLRHSDVVVQRFLREAKLASKLDHPYAAHIYAFGIELDGLCWIAMEMVHGTPLDRWLKERGPMSLEQWTPFFERVAEVVQCAHDSGIVHRDLKPSNVMVIERAGRLLPKLLDFGVAKLFDSALQPRRLDLPVRSISEEVTVSGGRGAGSRTTPSDPSSLAIDSWSRRSPLGDALTDAEATVGSPPYMSPEQWSDPIAVGPRSDLYSLAVLAYEVLSGRRPFAAAAGNSYAKLHLTGEVPELGGGLPAALDGFFRRALAKHPDERFTNALELAAAFRLLAGVAEPAELPRLDDMVRARWLADAPQPLAEAIAALDGARNVHQARDAAREVARGVVRYLLALALAARSQVREGADEEGLLELLRTLRRRELSDDERVRLLRQLVRPFVGRRGVHPLPELVDLVAPGGTGDDALAPALALRAGELGASEQLVGGQLARMLPELGRLLRAVTPLLEYELVVATDGAAECWTGLRRRRKALAIAATALPDGEPVLLDRDGRVRIHAWPLLQLRPPSAGAEPELFVFDGHSRRGARLVALPVGFEHHDAAIWDWFETEVFGDSEDACELADAPPYLGLAAFRAADAERFVGREREIDELVNRLRLAPLQIVVGPSGAGKSSFIHAGVIPALPPGWSAVTLRPGAAPMAQLTARLAALGTAGDATCEPARTVVIVVDQLEELFTLAPAAEREPFAAELARLSASADAATRVVCAVRDDFLMQVEALAPLRAQVMPAVFLLGNPLRDDLIRIVVEPARRVGYELSDPELARDMVGAVADRPGALALLSFTAARLWELRDRRFRRLSREAYDAMGGVGGALGKHAESLFASLSGEEQRLTREVFRHLVTSEQTRARLTVGELRERVASERATAVIDKLLAARLLAVTDPDGTPQIELIHEALIAAWPRLARWIREDAEGARMRDQLHAAARQWHDRGRPRGLLWRDDALAELERWRRACRPSLADVERSFADASRRASRRVQRVRTGLALAAFAALLGFAGAQLRSMRATDAARERAEALLTASYVEDGRKALLEGRSAEAAAYLAAAWQRGDHEPAVAFLLARATEALQPERLRLAADHGVVYTVDVSPDGTHIATGDDSGATLWDARTGAPLFALAHRDSVQSAVFSADGGQLVTASADGTVRLWDVATGRNLRTLVHDRAGGAPAPEHYRKVALSPRGNVIAAISDEGAFTDVWDRVSGARVAAFHDEDAHGPNVDLAFTSDGRWLAVANQTTHVDVFDTRNWTLAVRLPAGGVPTLAFDPRGDRLATGSWSGAAAVWEIPSGTRVLAVRDGGEKIDRITYSRDGAWIAIASRDGTVRVHHAASGVESTTIREHRGAVQWLEIDPTGTRVASGGVDGVVAVSDRGTGARIARFERAGGTIFGGRFVSDGGELVVASRDGFAHVWRMTGGYQRFASPPVSRTCETDKVPREDDRFLAVSCLTGAQLWDSAHDQLLATLPGPVEPRPPLDPYPAFTATGDRAAVAFGTTVRVLALPGGTLLRTIPHPSVVRTLAFAPSGHDLVTASADGTLLLIRGDTEPQRLPARGAPLTAVAFTPDGEHVVVASGGDHRIRVYSLAGTIEREIEHATQANDVLGLRLSSDGSKLVTIEDHRTTLWDLHGGRLLAVLSAGREIVFSARFVGDRVLTASNDGVARLWDATTGQLARAFVGSSVFLLDAVVDPTGAMVVTGGGDGYVRYWDVESGRLLWELRAHGSLVNGVHFDGDDLVTRGSSGEIAHWSIPQPPAAELDRRIRLLPAHLEQMAGGHR